MMGKRLILGQKIRESGYNLTELCSRHGLNRSTYQGIIERGSGRRIQLEQIAFALGCTYDDLFEEYVDELPPYILDNTALLEAADEHTAQDDQDYVKALRGHAMKIGLDISALLNEADGLFQEGDFSGACNVYSGAISQLKPWHIARLRTSLGSLFHACKQAYTQDPVLTLYEKFKRPAFYEHNCEILYAIGCFLADNPLNKKLTLEVLGFADNLVK